MAELEERETALREREEAMAAEEERLRDRAARLSLLEAREHENHEHAQAAGGERTAELDRRERELLRRERALGLRLQTFEGRVRDAWDAENTRRREEAGLQAELEARDERSPSSSSASKTSLPASGRSTCASRRSRPASCARQRPRASRVDRRAKAPGRTRESAPRGLWSASRAG